MYLNGGLVCADSAVMWCDPGPLQPDTFYYWRVESKNNSGTIQGPTWYFTTQDREQFSSLDVPKSIDDDATITSTLTIGPSGTILDLEVQLDITHTFDGDLHVYLTSPQSTTVELFNSVGGSGDNFSDTLLDDEAATPIIEGSAPFAGSYQPEGLVSDFNGEDMQGVWTLTITDTTASDTGTLNGWDLFVQFSAIPGGPEIWIDFDWTGLETGHRFNPFNTFGEGAGVVDTGGVLKINAGSTSEIPQLLNSPMTFEAVGGTVLIGVP